MHSELRKKNVTLRLLWVEYREAHPDGYGYSQFCVLYRQWAKHLQPSMRLTHKAGEKVFVDYAGQTVPIVDPQTGEVRQAQIFIGVLGASSWRSDRPMPRPMPARNWPTGSAPTCACSHSSVGCPRSWSRTISKQGSSNPVATSPI